MIIIPDDASASSISTNSFGDDSCYSSITDFSAMFITTEMADDDESSESSVSTKNSREDSFLRPSNRPAFKRACMYSKVRAVVGSHEYNLEMLEEHLMKGLRILKEKVKKSSAMLMLSSTDDDVDAEFHSIATSIEEAINRKRSLLMLLEAFLDVFTPQWINWPEASKKNAYVAIKPLSVFKSLLIEDRLSFLSLNDMVGIQRGTTITPFLSSFASTVGLGPALVKKHLMNGRENQIAYRLEKLNPFERDITGAFQRLLETMNSFDDVEGGCIVFSTGVLSVGIRSYYKFRGKNTPLMKLRGKLPELPTDETGWVDLLTESYFNYVKGPLPLHNTKADKAAKAKHYSGRRDGYERIFPNTPLSDDSSEDEFDDVSVGAIYRGR